ncbi:MAG: YaiI/YqxD family protein [Magnetococcales bacterium]|nr:YaiI/YqxD family protein [Magnetococcales bacterium]MBF0116243.1 YaiI/YqxD family protein [Magnetococcales bacterium]
MKIYVDADACPVKGEVMRVAERHGRAVHMVSNQRMRLPTHPLLNIQVVAGGLDKADDWIVERIAAGDIAVTADIPLAARCLSKGARVLGPTGKPFDDEGIGMALAMRELNAHLRDAGEIRGGGPSFSNKDRSRFLQALEAAIQALKRGG